MYEQVTKTEMDTHASPILIGIGKQHDEDEARSERELKARLDSMICGKSVVDTKPQQPPTD